VIFLVAVGAVVLTTVLQRRQAPLARPVEEVAT